MMKFVPILLILSIFAWDGKTPALAASNSPWNSLASTGKGSVRQLVTVGENIYALNEQGQVLRLEKDEKSWTPLTQGLEIFSGAQAINLSAFQNVLYAFVRSSDGSKQDVFKLEGETWKGLNLPKQYLEWTDDIYASSRGFIIGKGSDSGAPSLLLVQTGQSWKAREIPKDLRVRPGMLHPLYGISTDVFYLNPANKWKVLAKQWGQSAGEGEILEVGQDIYAGHDYAGLALLKSNSQQWTLLKFPENCHDPSSMNLTGKTIYLKATCTTADKEREKIFSFSTTTQKWGEIESPSPEAPLGPLLLKDSKLYLSTQGGGFYKLALNL